MMLLSVLNPYLWITRARNALYNRELLKAYHSTLPVVSVGNLTVGGNGKTPIVIRLAQLLKEAGRSPVVLSRGYGGSYQGVQQLKDSSTAELVGDEPLLMQSFYGLTVVVARRRSAGLQFIEQQGLGDIVILDDGLQHRAVHRDLDIVAIDIGTPKARQQFVAGQLLPLGVFREERDAGLRRGKIVVLAERKLISSAGLEDIQPEILGLIPRNIKIFRSYISAGEVVSADGTHYLQAPAEIDLFSAIAKPQGFVETLKTLGFSVVNSTFFPDHRGPTDRQLAGLVSAAQGRPLVCTEKDLVRLKPAELPAGLWVLKSATRVDPESSFIDAVIGELHFVS